MFRKVCLLIAIIAASCATVSQADDFLLAQLYGNGVHAYNSGDYNTAYRELTSAIQGGTIDPRAYYFRGLTFLRLGRQQEAVADFKKGAEMETGDTNDVFPVSNSLARVQGPDREMLERYREAARVTAHQRQEIERQAKYEQRIEAEKTVLRKVQPTDLTPTPDSCTSKLRQPARPTIRSPNPNRSHRSNRRQNRRTAQVRRSIWRSPCKGSDQRLRAARQTGRKAQAHARERCQSVWPRAGFKSCRPAGDKPQPAPAGKPAADSKSKPAPVDDNPFK